MKKVLNFVIESSLLLVLGAVIALAWANIDVHSYHHLLELDLPFLRNSYFGLEGADGLRHFNLHFIINDILMAFFFAMAGKEVWESTFPGGPLSRPKTAATPLIATAGGVIGPVLVFVIGAHLFGQWDALHKGWAIPTATDIAFSAMIARVIFGSKHPAVPFLLLLAIADDAIGLVIIAIFYTKGAVLPLWLLLSAGAAIFGYVVFNRALKIRSIWPYVALFAISWVGFALAGVHTSLSFIPIVIAMPHAYTDKGIFSPEEEKRRDTLNRFEHTFKVPVEIILFMFGFASAGVAFNVIGFPTYLIMIALILGKTVGIFSFGSLAAKGLRFGLPEGMNYRDLAVLGSVAGIGFTVALFVASVAYPAGEVQDAAKLGALFSLGAAVVSFVLARILQVKKVTESSAVEAADGEGGADSAAEASS